MATLGRGGFALVAVVTLLLAGTPVRAGQPTEQLRVEIEQVIKVLDDPERERDLRLRRDREALAGAPLDVTNPDGA